MNTPHYFGAHSETLRAALRGTPNVGAAHHSAVMYPRPEFESPVLELLVGLAGYADAHRDRYESEVGEDGVLGDHFEEIARGLLGLLNGETGRLDCGTLDGAIRKLCKAAKAEGIEQ